MLSKEIRKSFFLLYTTFILENPSFLYKILQREKFKKALMGRKIFIKIKGSDTVLTYKWGKCVKPVEK